MIDQVVVGTVAVLLRADASGLIKGSKDAEASLKSVEKVAANISNRVKVGVAAAFAAAATGIVLLTTRSLENIDVQSKLARQLGGSIEGIQVLTRTADLAGISQEELTKALERVQRKLGEAARDAKGEAADAFRRLGLSVSELSKMDVDKRMGAIADATKRLGLTTQQVADLLGQFGIRGGKIAALFENGSKAINDARSDLELFGVLVNKVQGEQVEMANDAVTVFKLAATGIANQLAVEVSTLMKITADGFRQFVSDAGGMQNIVAKVVEEIVVGFGVLPSIWYSARIAFDVMMDAIIGGLNLFADAWNATLGKISFSIDRIENTYGNLHKTLETPPDADGIRKWWQSQREAAKKAAEESIKDRDALMGTNKGNFGLGSKEMEGLQKRVLALKQAMADESEVLKIAREKQILEEQQLYEKGALSLQQHNEMKLKIEENYQQKRRELIWNSITSQYASEFEQLEHRNEELMKKVEEFEASQTISREEAEKARMEIGQKYALQYQQLLASTWSAVAGVVDTAMGQIKDIMQDESEKGFTIMKAIAYATALVKGYEAVVSAWATGEKTGIPGMGAVMAGIAAAGTAAVIAKLAGVGQNSKGTVSSTTGGGGGGGGGGGRAQQSAASQQSSNRTLFVSGLDKRGLFDNDTVRDLAQKLVEFQRDGGKVVVL